MNGCGATRQVYWSGQVTKGVSSTKEDSQITVNYKHKHGTKNPIIAQEEKAILLAVDRALSSSSNSQTIGRNGEIPLLEFLNRYLPPTFKSASGHFITPEGNISPQIDVMVLDSRYPLLAENLDGSVLAMLHSVVYTIEVKTNLISSDIKKISRAIRKTRDLIGEVDIFENGSFSSPINRVLAYRSQNKLETVEKAFQQHCDPDKFHYDIIILRLSEKDLNNSEVGCNLHFEPITSEGLLDLKENYDFPEDSFKGEFLFGTRASHTPLSDFYYELVQNGYYMLGERDFHFNDIGQHIMDYMEWSTASWDELYK